MRIFYLVAAIVGTVLPWASFLPFLLDNGIWPGTILTALYVNGATTGLSTDFFLTCGVFWVFVIRDATRLGLRGWWFTLPAAPLIGLSMAVPAYLFIREGASHDR